MGQIVNSIPTFVVSEDRGIALRVIAYAAMICPMLHSLDGDAHETAIAILRAAAENLASMPASYIDNESDGPFRTGYSAAQVRTAFGVDDLATLRSLCGGTSPRGPIGQFPPPSASLLRMWPE